MSAGVVKYLHDYLTGRVIGRKTVALCDPYSGEWITDAMVEEFQCRRDDVGCVETETGEFMTVRGEIVAYVDTN